MATPITGGFKFDLKPPIQKPGTFTGAEVNSMSDNLAIAGLSCAANTPEKMLAYIDQVKTYLQNNATPGSTTGITSSTSGFSRNRKLLVAEADDSPQGPVPPYHYVVKNINPFFSKMSVVLKNLDKIEQEKLHYVQSHHENKTFQSTAVGAITEALDHVGQVIGEISSGNVDPDQIANEMGAFIQQMTSTSENDFSVSDSNYWFIVVPKLDSHGNYPAIGGVEYNFNMNIHNYEDKKNDEHTSHYVVNQRNIIFTDGNVFEEVYKKVVSA